ncbi:BREX-2 system phosphatase PglZ [Kutzneria sp. CA-103260]|uniref:BREX-2 system phosphatase PglZ n=1 Tax=Kutzneria sp. CA-103260 TaxID=2802641 RepID=UPI001BA8D839|nr:BREX-2 system phosphatase PglZ [Kutzneria sp. CA-103260]QUQ68268.1 bacteriophage resistance gene pglZ [Kutzneria sp. CA-103260]
MTAPPEVNRRIIEALLQRELPRAKQQRLVLVHGRYDTSSASEFGLLVEGQQRRIKVSDQPSVLGIVEAWQRHRSSPDTDVLVVTTGVDDAELGWDLRGYAVGRATRTVDRVEIVKQRFGATDIDPRIRREPWLVDALLDAEPTVGWRRAGGVLTRDTAVRALIGARLGSRELAEGTLDVGALLSWSRTAASAAHFAELTATERKGLTDWLEETVGSAAVVLMTLVGAGRAEDAMPLGTLGAVLSLPGVSPDATLAFGSVLGVSGKRGSELREFVKEVEGTLERWIAEAEFATQGEAARQRVLDIVRRADELASSADLTVALAPSRFLPSSFSSRLRTLAENLSPARRTAAESALSSLRDHALARLYPDRVHTAAMAVRLTRWLAEAEETVDSVAAGVQRQLASWGWVDHALAVLWAGDAVHDPVVGRAYRAVHDKARARRDRLDEAFARRLEIWAAHASTQAPGGCLLVEDVLERIAVPLVGKDHAPLILVLDGMSSAVAVELGEQLAGRAWHEASPYSEHRAAAVAAVPSVTRVSRACLLTAGLTNGDQSVEKDGFAAFWRKHRKQASLFHKAEIGGHAGQRLAESLVAALAGEDVVGVVLNTIDDALDHGKGGAPIGWRLSDVTYLPELLDAARAYERPVVLVADHGHVLDRSTAGDGPVAAVGVESARWRVGDPADGEVALAGPRVLYGDGRVVVPWREDIRYLPKKAGYHGGASLAEMTVPVLVLLPSATLLPVEWEILARESVEPSWWSARAGVEAEAAPRRKPTKVRARIEDQATPLFPVEESLGTRVVASPAYETQRAFVPKAPNKKAIAAVIDELVKADRTRPITAVAALVGRAGRNPDFLARMLERLLNVEGYPVLSVTDGGRTLKLDVDLLCEQFGVQK